MERMTDDWLIEVIAKRMDDEVPWTRTASIFKHQDWVDIVEHLWHDKKLRGPLMDAYKTDIVNARAKELLEIPEADRMPL